MNMDRTADHAKPPGDKPSRLTAAEAEELRERCWTLRMENGLSITAIGQIVGRDRSQVSRMLSQMRRRMGRRYTPGGRFDPTTTIGALVDRCERIAALAMQQYTLATETRDRLRALRTALLADAEMRSILQEVGLMPRDLGTMQIEAGRVRASASEIRALAHELRKMHALPAENVFDLPLTARGEQAYLTGEVIDSTNGDGADRDADDSEGNEP